MTDSTVAGKDGVVVFFWGGELGRVNPRGGGPGKKHLQDLGIFITEIAANASNLITSSYIWKIHLLILFAPHLSKIIGGVDPPAPPLATALTAHSWQPVTVSTPVVLLISFGANGIIN